MGKLTANARKHIAPKNFAVPSKAPGPGSYPIENFSHAKNALARVHQFGTNAEISQVTEAVRKKFPSLINIKEKGKI